MVPFAAWAGLLVFALGRFGLLAAVTVCAAVVLWTASLPLTLGTGRSTPRMN